MEKLSDVLSDVLREACRHLEIEASISRIAALLGARMPLGLLLVREYDAAEQRLATVAVGSCAAVGPVASQPTLLSPRPVKRLAAWAASGEIRPGPLTADLAVVIPADVMGDVLVGPWGASGSWDGLLLLVARAGAKFSRRDAALAQALLEPFTTALQNDRRLHELASLREAAEAERRSLLTRIGRPEDGEEIVGAESGLKLVMERVELVRRRTSRC